MNALAWFLGALLALPPAVRCGAPMPKPGTYPGRPEGFRKPGPSYRVEARPMDSLRYVLGELDCLQEDYDSALGIHLSIPLPSSGIFRDSMLAQRARIFDRIWPASALSEREAAASRPSLDWEISSGHSRSFSKSGPDFPYGQEGTGFRTQAWSMDTQAGLTWPLSLHERNGSLTAQARLSPSRTSPDLDLELRAKAYDVIWENLSLAGGANLRKSAGLMQPATFSFSSSRYWPFEKGSLSVDAQLDGEWKQRAAFNLSSSRYWPSEKGSLSVQAHAGGDWQNHGGFQGGNAGMGFTRSTYLAGESSFDFSLNGAIQSRKPETQGLAAPVLYVDDIARIRPTHFQGPEFRDTLSQDAPSPYELYILHAGEQSLSLRAPQTSFSATPSFAFGFPLFAGWQAQAGTHYGMDLYPEYAWDEAPGPDGLEPFSGDFRGLALNRADGRRYAVVLVEGEGEGEALGEYYGARPLEHRKARRWDQKAGLDFNLSRYFGGQFLTLGASAEFGWSNLPCTAPASSTPWQWNANFTWSRAWDLPSKASPK